MLARVTADRPFRLFVCVLVGFRGAYRQILPPPQPASTPVSSSRCLRRRLEMSLRDSSGVLLARVRRGMAEESPCATAGCQNRQGRKPGLDIGLAPAWLDEPGSTTGAGTA